MVFFSGNEIVDIVLMTIVIGIIFMDFFKKRIMSANPFDQFSHNRFFNKQGFLNAIYIVAPAIILHEFGHKFVALAFGLSANFHAAYLWLIIGLFLKFAGAGFIFFVPAYISIAGNATALQYSAVAFAGPLVNLLMFLGILIFFKYAKHKKMLIKKNTMLMLLFAKKINLFLFIFNMLPIPMFDGFSVFRGLIQAFF